MPVTLAEVAAEEVFDMGLLVLGCPKVPWRQVQLPVSAES